MSSAGPAFSLQGVSKRFGRVIAVDDLWLDIEEGEFFALLGPSGCGKTTTLRMLAGFEEPDAGRILLRSADVTTTPPNRRDVNLVFQHYELFPHMSVFENVAFGLRLRKVREPELGRRVREALEIVRVGELEGRGARQLSGGQQQRVALARAIVNRPAVLLLDEPLSALDVKLRKQMQLELKAIQERLGTTFVYVTHDQEEALLLSDRIAVMDGGRLLQVATPRDLYERPAHAFVADFIGSLNVLAGRVARLGPGAALAVPEGAPDGGARLAFRPVPGLALGESVRVAVRPERIGLVREPDAAPGPAPRDFGPLDAALRGHVRQVVYLGSLSQLIVGLPGGAEVLCQRTTDGDLGDLEVGAPVWLTWPADAAFVLPAGPAEPPG